MAQKQLSKKELINKANTSMVAAIAIAGFLVVFALISSRALLAQRSYQAKVIAEKEKAVKQLEKNQEAVKQLETSYKAFVETPENVLGGNPGGTGDNDGNNAKIVLDALPSKYDFPAFITSLEKLLTLSQFKIETIGGKDDEVAQSNAKSKDPVEMPFKLTSEVPNYAKVKELLELTERSIRPIKVKKLTLTGGGQNANSGNAISVSVDGVSYYQAAKGLTIEKKVVK